MEVAAFAAKTAAAVAVKIIAATMRGHGRSAARSPGSGLVSAGGDALSARSHCWQVKGSGRLEQQLDGP
eukprot:631864-Pleurochrysis_carterae.AAC.1